MNSATKSNHKMRNVIFVVVTLFIAIFPSILTGNFNFGISPILTGSMEPGANPGDVFITRLEPAGSLQVGDIIAINNQITGTYYSHRIQEIRDVNGTLRVITKGDANKSLDLDPFMVSPTSQVSKVVTLIPKVGTPLIYMSSTQGRQLAANILVAANILGLFAFLFRRKIALLHNPDRVYKELFSEERHRSNYYREIINNLHESRVIEREDREMIGSIK